MTTASKISKHEVATAANQLIHGSLWKITDEENRQNYDKVKEYLADKPDSCGRYSTMHRGSDSQFYKQREFVDFLNFLDNACNVYHTLLIRSGGGL